MAVSEAEMQKKQSVAIKSQRAKRSQKKAKTLSSLGGCVESFSFYFLLYFLGLILAGKYLSALTTVVLPRGDIYLSFLFF